MTSPSKNWVVTIDTVLRKIVVATSRAVTVNFVSEATKDKRRGEIKRLFSVRDDHLTPKGDPFIDATVSCFGSL